MPLSGAPAPRFRTMPSDAASSSWNGKPLLKRVDGLYMVVSAAWPATKVARSSAKKTLARAVSSQRYAVRIAPGSAASHAAPVTVSLRKKARFALNVRRVTWQQ